MGNLCTKNKSSNISEFKGNPLNKSINVNEDVIIEVNGDVNKDLNGDDDSTCEVLEVLSEELVNQIPPIPSNLKEFSQVSSSLMAVFIDNFKIKINISAPIEMALRCLCGLAIFYSKV